MESILANLNNDKTIDAKDATVWGLKTWAQFLGIFKQVWDQIWKEKALSNLVEHAKLVNKTLWVGLPDALFNPKTIEADIKDGHTWIILLLQNVISNPWEDLYTLLSGHPENPFEGLDLQKENEAAQKYAEKMVKDMDMEGLRGIGLQTPEDIQTGLAWALFSEYKRWIWLWGQMSFDQWVKWLAMNTWFQVRDGGKVVVWIGLDYRRKINLWKWWSTTPDVSAWAFIPLWYGSPEWSGTVGLNEEVAKERITSKWVQNKLGMQAWATLLIPTVTPVISAGLTWERDKAAWIEYREQEMKWEMAKEIKTVLESINNRLWETPVKLDFNNAHTSSIIKEELESMAAKLWVKSEEVDSVVNATTRLLLNYNNANLSDENVRSIIAIRVADQYAMAWAEARKAHISKNTYLSWANLGAFRVVGSPLVWVYAWIKRTDHDLDGYGDRWGQEHTIDNSEMNSEMTEGRRTEKSLNALNTRLGLAEGQGLSFVDKSYPNSGIKIPNSLRNRVKVSKSMEWRLAKDESGNVLVSPWTIMSESVAAWAATQSKELLIWAWEKSDFVHLDTVGNNWFAKDIKEVNGIILEQSNAEFYTPDGIKKAINQLKQKTNNALLNQFNPSENEINSLIATLKELPEHNKKARIIIERQSDGNFIMRGERWVHEWKWLELEYKAILEMFDTKAKELANKVYERAASLNDPTALNRVKHPIGQRHPEYEEFVSNLMWLNGKQKDINAAKTALDKIITRLNNSYKDKPLPIAETEWPTDKDALEQVLMSINNVFARSTKVKWAGSETADNVQYNKYEFTTNMGNIIKEREKQIGGTLQQKIKWENAEDVKNAYGRLMLATADYREKNKDKFNVTSAKSAHLNNAVWFNLWDQYNPENPLFDPEIYEQTIDLTDDVDSEYFTQADKDTLHRRAIENFITKPALFEPVKKVLWLPSSALVKIKDWAEIKNGVIELDIWGKIIKLSSDMKFGYFTQCVNHTIILDDVKLEDDKWNIVSFTSGSWANGRYVEWDKTSIVSTTTVGLSGSVIVHNGNNEPAKTDNTPVKTDDATQWWEQINTNPSWTDEVPVDPIIAWDGQETVSWDIR